MNRGEIRDEIRRLVSDTSTDTSRQTWSDAILNTRIDAAHEKIACITKCIETRYTDSLVSGTSEYALPSYYLEVISVAVKDNDGNWKQLIKSSENELDIQDSGWRDRDGSNLTNFYIRNGYIGIYPNPDYASTNGLRVDMYRRPTAFTADTDIPFDSNNELYAFHDILAYEVATKCSLDSRKKEDAAYFRGLVEDGIRKINYQLASDSEDTRMINVYESDRETSRHIS